MDQSSAHVDSVTLKMKSLSMSARLEVKSIAADLNHYKLFHSQRRQGIEVVEEQRVVIDCFLCS